jgi:hypothetical protein
MGVGSAVTVDVEVSVGGNVASGVLLLSVGVCEGVFVGTPMTAVTSSGFSEGVIVEKCVADGNAIFTVAGTGVARPVFSIAHFPKPVSEVTMAMRTRKTSAVKLTPPAEVG